jgi:hypothetical protein
MTKYGNHKVTLAAFLLNKLVRDHEEINIFLRSKHPTLNRI